MADGWRLWLLATRREAPPEGIEAAAGDVLGLAAEAALLSALHPCVCVRALCTLSMCVCVCVCVCVCTWLVIALGPRPSLSGTLPLGRLVTPLPAGGTPGTLMPQCKGASNFQSKKKVKTNLLGCFDGWWWWQRRKSYFWTWTVGGEVDRQNLS